MNHQFPRWIAVAAFAIAGAIPVITIRAHADDAPVAKTELAAVDQLKTQAFADIRVGNFGEGNDLLGKAAKLSTDPSLAKMHVWTSQFEDQLRVFADERHKSYDKSVEEVKKLLPAHEAYALDFAEGAQLLSDDKKAFHDLPWMQTLIAATIKRAGEFEKAEEWSHAARLYSDLAVIEPASKDWKEKLKATMRHVRLLANYAPEVYSKINDSDLKERNEVLALLVPSTQPVATTAAKVDPKALNGAGGVNPSTRPGMQATTAPMGGPAGPDASNKAMSFDPAQPTTKPDPEIRNENFKSDWHDTVKGIKLNMLVSALHDAYTNYYRDVTYRQLMAGGLDGIQAIINTKGLENAFPALSDAGKKAEFQKYLDGWKSVISTANATNEEDLFLTLLSEDKDGLLAANARTLQLPDEVLISEFADGSMATLDPFTSMIWPSDLAEFTKATQGEFSGIGVQIMPEDNGDLQIVRPLPDGPAERLGIKGGDVITMIGGKSAAHITSDEAVKNITGPSGTMVHLTIRSPDGKSKEYDVRREKIKVESCEGYRRVDGSKWDYYIDPENKIAYIRITSFSKTTVDELTRALDGMGDNVNGVIIDLRENPGGLLQAAIGVCDEFLKEGTIVSTRPDRETPNSPTLSKARDDGTEFTKPLVVLVNQLSASASEIVSGALKDDHRAILVGQRTFGKGSVQQIFPPELRPDAEWKITTAHYYLPSGRCIHREENSTEWGVDPDVTVDMTPEQMRAANEARAETELGHPLNTPAAMVNQAIKDAATLPSVIATPTTQPSHKTLLEADPQLAAGLLVIRLELTGAHL